jgi:hypothetical protein
MAGAEDLRERGAVDAEEGHEGAEETTFPLDLERLERELSQALDSWDPFEDEQERAAFGQLTLECFMSSQRYRSNRSD